MPLPSNIEALTFGEFLNQLSNLSVFELRAYEKFLEKFFPRLDGFVGAYNIGTRERHLEAYQACLENSLYRISIFVAGVAAQVAAVEIDTTNVTSALQGATPGSPGGLGNNRVDVFSIICSGAGGAGFPMEIRTGFNNINTVSAAQFRAQPAHPRPMLAVSGGGPDSSQTLFKIGNAAAFPAYIINGRDPLRQQISALGINTELIEPGFPGVMIPCEEGPTPPGATGQNRVFGIWNNTIAASLTVQICFAEWQGNSQRK